MNQRFLSLDIFRGATVALMILVNNPGSWDAIYSPLEHAPWHGCTPTDLVFPFFLFAVGNSTAFVMPRFVAAGDSVFLQKIFIRSLLIFSIGLFLNWFPFMQWKAEELVTRHWVNPEHPDSGVRILGVLQRIALCYFFASLIIYYFKIRGAFAAAMVLLFGYWALCLLAGDHLEPFSMQGFFGSAIDRSVLGIAHMFKGEGVPFDPEGLASTLPAIAQVIFGYLVGNYIVQKGKNPEMLSSLFAVGCVLVFTGLCWSTVFPLNKKIWTSSFVVYTTGLAVLVLCVLMQIIEFRARRGWWIRFFEVFGKNPLFIFVLSGLLPRALNLIRIPETGGDGHSTHLSPLEWFYAHVCRPLSENQKNSSLIYAVIVVGFFWLLGYWMDKKKIYLRV